MQKIIKSVVLLFISITTYSQDFEEGYYIKEGNKINGLIKYENWLKSPQTILFKSNLNDRAIEVNASQITGFFVHSEDYIAQKVAFVLYTDLPRMNITKYPLPQNQVEGAYFLRVLHDNNNIKLFELIDRKEDSHLFMDNQGSFGELIYYKDYLYDDKAQEYFLKEKKKYIGQLRALFSDCKKLNISDNLLYNKRDILAVINSYENCIGETSINKIDSKSKEDKINFSYGFLGGMFHNATASNNWFAGLAVRINFPRNYRNSYVMLETDYYQYQITSSTSSFSGISIVAGTHFGKKQIRPFINPGLTITTVQAFPFVGGGLSYKRNLRVEYRKIVVTGIQDFGQIMMGYMFNL
jgi:hypothetical protein